jgi:cytochrome c-type biogenesis protein CcmH
VLSPQARRVFGADPVSFQEIEESLTCQCGCGLTVHSCNHLQCGSAIPLRQEIRDQMSLGKSREQILTYFKGKYGEKILSSPTTSGFNVLAWITPFILVALGALFVCITIMRWSGRSHGAAPGDATGEPPSISPYDKVMEKELKEFEE